METIGAYSSQRAFEFVAGVLKENLQLSEEHLTNSKSNCRELTDARRICYKVLRDLFKLSFQTIGALFNRDHSTVIFSVRRHDDLYGRDKKYTSIYNTVMKNINERADDMVQENHKSVTLKTLHSSEKESYDIKLCCFSSRTASDLFMAHNGILKEHVVYRGDASQIIDEMAAELAAKDEKRFVQETMKASMFPFQGIVNKYYMDYQTDKFTFVNNAVGSLRSATSLFNNKVIALIFVQRAA